LLTHLAREDNSVNKSNDALFANLVKAGSAGLVSSSLFGLPDSVGAKSFVRWFSESQDIWNKGLASGKDKNVLIEEILGNISNFQISNMEKSRQLRDVRLGIRSVEPGGVGVEPEDIVETAFGPANPRFPKESEDETPEEWLKRRQAGGVR